MADETGSKDVIGELSSKCNLIKNLYRIGVTLNDLNGFSHCREASADLHRPRYSSAIGFWKSGECWASVSGLEEHIWRLQTMGKDSQLQCNDKPIFNTQPTVWTDVLFYLICRVWRNPSGRRCMKHLSCERALVQNQKILLLWRNKMTGRGRNVFSSTKQSRYQLSGIQK